MPKESKEARSERAAEIDRRLAKAYPDARCLLDHSNPYELLTATILAAQCTDDMVNKVTKDLFRKYPTPADLAAADPGTLGSEIKSTGFFRQKAKSIHGMAEAVVKDHGGEVPGTMEELVELPGVGRKTANVVLGNCFDAPAIIVDTHMIRVSRRLGLASDKLKKNADKIEAALQEVIDEDRWTAFSHEMTFHGRRCCTARKPRCPEGPVEDLCPWPEKTQP